MGEFCLSAWLAAAVLGAARLRWCGPAMTEAEANGANGDGADGAGAKFRAAEGSTKRYPLVN